MNKFDIEIAVVPNEKLFPTGQKFEGFRAHSQEDFTTRILENYTYMRRGDAEVDFSHKQPIGYGLIKNSEGKYFFYQRGSKRSGEHETRLAGKWACGIGGHIEAEDEETGNILTDSLIRELEEEITLNGSVTSAQPIGYINYEGDEVSQVHIGVLYLIETDATTAIGSEEVVNEGFYSKEEILKKLNNPELVVEEWTRIVFDHIFRSR